MTTYSLPARSSPEALAAFPREMALKYDAVPLEVREQHLYVGIADVADNVISLIRQASRMPVRFVQLQRDNIIRRLQVAYPPPSTAPRRATTPDSLFDAAVREGYRRRATDVLIFNDGETAGEIKLRIDGRSIILHKDVPSGEIARTIRGVLNRAGVKDADNPLITHRAQMTYEIDENVSLMLRITVVPTHDGKRQLGCRLAMPSSFLQFLDQLGFSAPSLARLATLADGLSGIRWASAPPGHGKTTMQLALMAAMKKTYPECELYSIECPVDQPLSWLHQQSVEDSADDKEYARSYGAALEGLLAFPLDGMLFGEVRSPETVQQVLRAGKVGVPVFATTHGEGCGEMIGRLLIEGGSPIHLAQSFRSAVSIRLLPRLCEQCRVPAPPDVTERWLKVAPSDVKPVGVYVAPQHGCHNCVDGYHGRTPVVEILVGTEEVRDAIAASKSAREIVAGDPEFAPLVVDMARAVVSGLVSPRDTTKWVALP